MLLEGGVKMSLKKLNIGVGLCGSFCTLTEVIDEIERLCKMSINVTPVMSYNSQSIDTRFGKAHEFLQRLEDITGNEVIKSIEQAEPIGPQNKLDAFLIAPCTGNTLAKLNSSITDTPVLMAAKAHIRNNKPLIVAVATNDALSNNFKNIGELMNKKNIYFVPFGQDDYIRKTNSIIADFTQMLETIEEAIRGEQIQPVLLRG